MGSGLRPRSGPGPTSAPARSPLVEEAGHGRVETVSESKGSPRG